MRIGIVSIVVLSFIAGCATQAPTKVFPESAPAQAPATTSGPQSKEPFISRSAVFFPGETQDFALAQKYKYPDVMDGAQLTYRYEPLPNAKIDFFVFAVGRGPQDYILKQGMARIRGEISGATKAGLYADTVFGDESSVTVTAEDGSKLTGARLQLSYTMHGTPSLSAAYMFYKQLYYVELRISAPDSAGADALLKAGNLAADEILPRIHMLSEGDCETLSIDMSSMPNPDQVQKSIDQSLALRQAEGCPPSKRDKPEDFQPKTGEDMLMLSYTLADWQ